jgi:branched-chain amino acid transport system substrate-binding protein
MMRRPWRAAALVSILTLLLSTACLGIGSGGESGPVLKIGVDLPLSGDEGRVAMPALNGVRFYVLRHPTLDGFTVTVVAKDDSVGGTPEPQIGAADVQAFADDHTVMAVIGPFDSNVARAEIPVANRASLPMLSPATSSPCLTRTVYLPAQLNPTGVAITCKDAGLPSATDLRPSGVNNYFRLATTDDLQGPAAADFAYKTLDLLRVATVSDHEAYGQALAAGFTTRFRKLGGSVVGHLDVDPTANVDASAFLGKVKADGAQAIYYGGTTANKGCVIRSQMAGVFGAGRASFFLGGDGIAEDPACVQDAGAEAAGIYATVPSAAGMLDTAGPVIAAFKAAFPKLSDYDPYAVVAYDATGVVYDALDRAIKAAGGQLPPRGNVVSQLSATQGFPGATGLLGFDSNGDSTRRLVSIFEAAGADPTAPWRLVGTADYTAALPY